MTTPIPHDGLLGTFATDIDWTPAAELETIPYEALWTRYVNTLLRIDRLEEELGGNVFWYDDDYSQEFIDSTLWAWDEARQWAALQEEVLVLRGWDRSRPDLPRCAHCNCFLESVPKPNPYFPELKPLCADCKREEEIEAWKWECRMERYRY